MLRSDARDGVVEEAVRVVRIGGWAGRTTGRRVGRPGGGGVERASAVRVVQGVERLVGGALGRGWWGGGQGSSPREGGRGRAKVRVLVSWFFSASVW